MEITAQELEQLNKEEYQLIDHSQRGRNSTWCDHRSRLYTSRRAGGEYALMQRQKSDTLLQQGKIQLRCGRTPAGTWI